ncbi:MAG: hypothetical protein WAW36_05675, partial [Methylovulum miyakonense]
ALSKRRVFIEHVNRRCKIFRIVKDVYRGKHKNYSLTWNLGCIGQLEICLYLGKMSIKDNRQLLEGEPRVAKQNGVCPHPWGIAGVVSFYVLQDTDFFDGQALYKKYGGMGRSSLVCNHFNRIFC